MTPTEYQQLVEFLGPRFTEIDRRFAEMDGRFTETNGRIAELRREMLEHFDEIYRWLERLEQEYHAITQALPTSGAGGRSWNETWRS